MAVDAEETSLCAGPGDYVISTTIEPTPPQGPEGRGKVQFMMGGLTVQRYRLAWRRQPDYSTIFGERGA